MLNNQLENNEKIPMYLKYFIFTLNIKIHLLIFWCRIKTFLWICICWLKFCHNPECVLLFPVCFFKVKQGFNDPKYLLEYRLFLNNNSFFPLFFKNILPTLNSMILLFLYHLAVFQTIFKAFSSVYIGKKMPSFALI